jgi:hypothetical protein
MAGGVLLIAGAIRGRRGDHEGSSDAGHQ